jgi:uncharacterized protein (UPF0332 family)
MPGRSEVRRHLRLANGFMDTAEIREDSDEFQVRNALSRSYYGLFHACHAWLAMNNVPFSRRSQHELLIKEIGDRRGKEFGERLAAFWMLRKQADYDRPELLAARPFQGDVVKLRVSARGDRGRMVAELISYVSEVEGFGEPQ